jgi:hypothetical protein
MEKPSSLEDLNTEASRLRAQIERDQASLAEIETLLRLVEKYQLSVPHTRVTSEGALSMVLSAPQHATRSTGETVKELLLRTAAAILSDGRRRLSRELVHEMKRHGVYVPGEDQAGNLASYLSREKETFESNVKAGGWTLRQPQIKARPGEVGASSGLFSNGSEATHHAVSARKEDAELG